MLPRAALLLCCLSLVAGCGVAEYEARLKAAQERIKRREDESKLLGPGITVPQVKNMDGTSYPAVNMFLRLPKGLSTSPAAGPRLGLLHVYAPTQAGAAAPFAEVLIAYAKAGDAKFVEDVMKAFTASNTPTRTEFVAKPVGRPETRFTRTSFESNQFFYSVNHWAGTRQQVIVAYVLNNAQRGTGARALDLSLETFGGEGQSAEARKQANDPSPLERVPRAP